MHSSRISKKDNRRQQSIGQQKLRLEENTRNIDRIKEEKERADRLREEYLKWDRLCRHFGDERGKNFRNIAQSFVLKELLAGANFYLQRLTDRYELECQAGSLTILLRDFHQGGSARPACTLSGGESFLVSLSLALGLSSLSRQSLSVDTLFIDEGFGTLSSDYLNTVMDTLEKTAPDGWQEGRHHQSRGRTERAHKDPDTSTEDRQFKKRNRSGEYPLSWYRDKENECFFRLLIVQAPALLCIFAVS